MKQLTKQTGQLRSLGIIALAMVPTLALVLWYVWPSDPTQPVGATSAPLTTQPVQPISPLGSPLGVGPVAGAVGPGMLPDGHPQIGAPKTPAAAEITVSVSYDGDVAALPDSALVFVFVREPGSRMPLAVERRDPGELPVSVGFAGEGLSATGLEVVGRLTMDGDVRLKPGDREVTQSLDAQAKRSVRLVISAD